MPRRGGVYQGLAADLITAVESLFALDIPVAGKTPRQKIELQIGMLAERARVGITRPGDDKWLADLEAQLAGAEVPEATRYLLGWFYALHSERQSNGYAPCALTSAQIIAWRDLERIQISPWEIGVLRQLDNCWLRMWSEAREEEDRKRDTSKPAKDGTRPESRTIRN